MVPLTGRRREREDTIGVEWDGPDLSPGETDDEEQGQRRSGHYTGSALLILDSFIPFFILVFILFSFHFHFHSQSSVSDDLVPPGRDGRRRRFDVYLSSQPIPYSPYSFHPFSSSDFGPIPDRRRRVSLLRNTGSGMTVCRSKRVRNRGDRYRPFGLSPPFDRCPLDLFSLCLTRALSPIAHPYPHHLVSHLVSSRLPFSSRPPGLARPGSSRSLPGSSISNRRAGSRKAGS